MVDPPATKTFAPETLKQKCRDETILYEKSWIKLYWSRFAPLISVNEYEESFRAVALMFEAGDTKESCNWC